MPPLLRASCWVGTSRLVCSRALAGSALKMARDDGFLIAKPSALASPKAMLSVDPQVMAASHRETSVRLCRFQENKSSGGQRVAFLYPERGDRVLDMLWLAVACRGPLV